MSINEKLLKIQSKLKAKKSQFNKFGGYNYRSLEDIYEATKPLLQETKTTLRIDNDLEVFADKIFRKSIATLTCVETGEEVEVHTYTQESIEKKGMSAEQCSGSTASYSDKYCLNKLFCIDDNKDADTEEHANQGQTGRATKPKVENKPEPKNEEIPKRSRTRVPTENKKPENKPASASDSQWD